MEAKNEYGHTPLHKASLYNFIEIAKLLLDAGADVNVEDEDGETPLGWAGSDEMEALFKKYMK